MSPSLGDSRPNQARRGASGLGNSLSTVEQLSLPSPSPGPNALSVGGAQAGGGWGGRKTGVLALPLASPPEVKTAAAHSVGAPRLGRVGKGRAEDRPTPRAARAHRTERPGGWSRRDRRPVLLGKGFTREVPGKGKAAGTRWAFSFSFLHSSQRRRILKPEGGGPKSLPYLYFYIFLYPLIPSLPVLSPAPPLPPSPPPPFLPPSQTSALLISALAPGSPPGSCSVPSCLPVSLCFSL